MRSYLFYSFFIAICLVCMAFFFSGYGVAGFYEYTDDQGVKCYTDDESRIPQKDGVVVHKEKYDDLDEKQRQLMLEKERREIEEHRQETRQWLDYYKSKEQRRQAAEIEKQRLENRYTPVAIGHNQILVPVTFGYNGRKVQVPMILDTGAAVTALHGSVSSEIQVPAGRQGVARVAGGGIIKTRIVTVDYIQVGPKRLTNPTIMVLPEQGGRQHHAGLLGQDFLGQFSYTIDYARRAIRWEQ